MPEFNPYGYHPQTGTGGAVTPDVGAIDMARLVQMRHENKRNSALDKEKEKAREDAKKSDLFNKIYALDRDWYVGDMPAQKKLLQEIMVDAYAGNEEAALTKASEFKAIGDKSKEFNKTLLDIEKEAATNKYLNLPEVLGEIESNEYTLPDGKTKVNANEVQEGIGYGNVYAARKDILGKLVQDYDTMGHIMKREIAAGISNPKTIPEKQPDGSYITKTITDDAAIKYSLNQNWIDNKAMRDKETIMFNKAKQANPDELIVIDEKGTTKRLGDMTPKEYFIESKTPLFRKQKGVHKYAPSNSGGGMTETDQLKVDTWTNNGAGIKEPFTVNGKEYTTTAVSSYSALPVNVVLSGGEKLRDGKTGLAVAGGNYPTKTGDLKVFPIFTKPDKSTGFEAGMKVPDEIANDPKNNYMWEYKVIVPGISEKEGDDGKEQFDIYTELSAVKPSMLDAKSDAKDKERFYNDVQLNEKIAADKNKEKTQPSFSEEEKKKKVYDNEVARLKSISSKTGVKVNIPTYEEWKKTDSKSYTIKGKSYSASEVEKKAKESEMTVDEYVKAVNNLK